MPSGIWTPYFVIMLSLTVGSVAQTTVLGLQVPSPYHQILDYNITLNMDIFLRFYDCLRSAVSCKLYYTENHSHIYENKVMKLTHTYGRTHRIKSEYPQFAKSSLCTRTHTGEFHCIKCFPAQQNTEDGVGLLVPGGDNPCQCVYVCSNVRVSLDANRVEECEEIVEVIGNTNSRSKRASSRSRSSKSPARKPKPSRTVKVGGFGDDDDDDDKLSDEEVAIIVCVIVGVFLLVVIVVLVIIFKDKICKRNESLDYEKAGCSQENVTADTNGETLKENADTAFPELTDRSQENYELDKTVLYSTDDNNKQNVDVELKDVGN